MEESSSQESSSEPSYARLTRPQVETVLEMLKLVKPSTPNSEWFSNFRHQAMFEHLQRLAMGMEEQERLGSRSPSVPTLRPIHPGKPVKEARLKTAELLMAHERFQRLQSLAREQSRLAQELQSEADNTSALIGRLEDSMVATMCSLPDTSTQSDLESLEASRSR